jgi:hypothetical protein
VPLNFGTADAAFVYSVAAVNSAVNIECLPPICLQFRVSGVQLQARAYAKLQLTTLYCPCFALVLGFLHT